MSDADARQFVIRSHTWHETDRDFKNDLASLLKTDLAKAESFCAEYFDKFYLVHQVGHVILQLFNTKDPATPARGEYLANLFAVKYFEYKREGDYIDKIAHCMAVLTKAYRAEFDFDIERMNQYHERCKTDIVALAAWHFNAFLSSRRSTHKLAQVMSHMSRGQLATINSGILPRRGIGGQTLLQECLVTIFEMNGIMPDIRLEYCPSLALENFALEVLSTEQSPSEAASG